MTSLKTKKFLKFLLKVKVNLLLALLLSIGTVAVPILHAKLFRSYVGSSVFKVTDLQQARGSGSGFIVNSPKGKKFFITNFHLCEGLEIDGKILVSSDMVDKRKHELKVITKDENIDLCVAEPPPSRGGLSITEDIENGDTIHIFGHPIGFPLHKTSGEVIAPITIQMLAGKDVFSLHILSINAIQISAPSSPGNSGSPVVDNLGRVVGILFAGNRVNSYTPFMIPSKSLLEILSRVE